MARVLIVDDSAIMRRNLKTILIEAGHTVVGEAIHGGQAHQMYRTYTPDLVTMDITMPNVNGIEAVKLIRQEFPEAKIVMISALDQRSMVLEALKEGAKHYIIKPIEAETVINVVDKVLGTQNAEPGASPAEKPPEAGRPEAENHDPFKIENIDNTFQIILSPGFNEESLASLNQAVQGLLFVKPLKVVLNFDQIERLPAELLASIGEMVKAVKNVQGLIRVIAGRQEFIQDVKEKGIKELTEITEGV